MKISKEFKIGSYAIVILLCAWAGIRFLSGADIFGRVAIYKAYYEQVTGLQGASPVLIRGVKVGQVVGIEVAPEEPTKVCVSFTIPKKYVVPADSKATIVSTGIMGGKGIKITLGQSTQIASSGDVLEAFAEKDMLEALGTELSDIKTKFLILVDNLNITVSQLSNLISNNDKSVTDALTHLNSILAELDKSNIVANLDSFTTTLDNNGQKITEIVGGVDSLITTLNEREFATKLAEGVDNLNKALAQVNSNDGSIGKLLNDKQLYQNITEAAGNLSTLLEDLKAHPKRYINVSIFGRRDYEDKLAEKEAKQKAKQAKKEAKRGDK